MKKKKKKKRKNQKKKEYKTLKPRWKTRGKDIRKFWRKENMQKKKKNDNPFSKISLRNPSLHQKSEDIYSFKNHRD